MLKYVAAYLGAGLTFAAIDAVWLTTMADRLYRPVIGPLMADKSPKKPNAKKPGKSLKEKRLEKNAKRDEKHTGFSL